MITCFSATSPLSAFIRKFDVINPVAPAKPARAVLDAPDHRALQQPLLGTRAE